MMESQLVWARDTANGYVKANITEIGLNELEVLPVDSKHQKRICSLEDIFPSCEGESDHDDNCK